MTWKQLKEAIEEAGLEEGEDISIIQCENEDGDGTFHKMRLGKKVKLTENISEDARDVSGCAV